MCTIGLETEDMLASTFGGPLNWQLSGAKFLAMRFSLIIAVFLGPLLCLGVAKGQMVSMRKVGDETVMCLHTGLVSSRRDCGGNTDWYTYVFVGSISAMTTADKDEKRLQVHPEEIFYGDPPASVIVYTSQALCLPKLAVGDRWLFYLRKETDKPIILDYFGNGSLPVADAGEQIETLRRLETIGDRGIVRGRVIRGKGTQWKPVGDTRVIAHRAAGNLRFVTTTDSTGHFEFALLPPGAYRITVHPIGSFRPDDVTLDVSRGSCWDVGIGQEPHAEIGGYVRYPDGSPAVGTQALLISVDGSWWSTSQVAENGYFSYYALDAGRYVIGVRLTRPPSLDASSSGEPPPASLYYPGVQSRSAAVPIMLRTDEHRDNVDFTVTRQ
jgi:hypothetical protein